MITISKVLLCPLLEKICSFRTIRCVLPLLSLSFIGVQILLDYKYLYYLDLEAVDKDIHIHIYACRVYGQLPEFSDLVFGGPFIACCHYLVMVG